MGRCVHSVLCVVLLNSTITDSTIRIFVCFQSCIKTAIDMMSYTRIASDIISCIKFVTSMELYCIAL